MNSFNPTENYSSDYYKGVSLKYLLTKGKSYLKIGALKGEKSKSDKLEVYSELFQFSFGQDFYTKHLGRGEYKILNLYSGYDIGGMIATGKGKDNLFLPFLKLHVGLEIFKSKHVLIDNKVSYLVPFKKNLEFRGLVYCASLNFVFLT